MSTRSVTRVRRFGPRSLIMVILVGAVAVDLPFLGPGGSTVADPRITLPALIGCWAAFELVQLYLQFGKSLDNTVNISVTEIALGLGLLFATPADLIVAAVGTPVVIDLVRRKPLLKQAFNGFSRALNVGIALTLYHALVPADPLSVSGWVALCLAVTASGLASSVSVAAVISLSIGWLPLRDLRFQVFSALTLSFWGATIAFVAGMALQAGTSAVPSLLVSLGALLLMMRGVSMLTERHMNLASLHSFGQQLAAAGDVDSILTTALDTSANLLLAKDAEVYLRSTTDDDSKLLRVRQGSDGELAQTPVQRETLPRSRGVLNDRRTVVAAAPLTLGEEVILSVTGRAGTKRPFGPKDARLLDMVAHQTGANLHSAHLIEQLRHDALHDTLTDLPNRRFLLEKAHACVTGGHSVAFVWLGIRDLQAVNAALGHACGDELLVQVGRRLQAASGPDAVVARVGGDEFAILLPSGSDPLSASEQVETLLAGLARPVMLSRVQVLVRAATGVVVEPGGSGASAEDLLRRADIAMRFSHRTGREVEHYTPELESATSERLALAVDLQNGISRGELILHAQPQVNLEDGCVTGVEMLVRWNHPRLGLLMPNDFVPLAEQTGLDRPMTTWVLNRALEALRGWRAAGIPLNASVNVSPNALCDGRLRDLTEELLVQHGVPGEQLVIEVTESSLLTNIAMAADVLHGLSALGVRVSIDDFGTGFSSLSHLRRLPVDEIKVDYSFVRTMLADGDDAAIVRSVIGLGKDLGLACVAEGVEDKHVYAELQRLGCDSAQGFFMAPAMPLRDVARWIRATSTHTWTTPVGA